MEGLPPWFASWLRHLASKPGNPGAHIPCVTQQAEAASLGPVLQEPQAELLRNRMHAPPSTAAGVHLRDRAQDEADRQEAALEERQQAELTQRSLADFGTASEEPAAAADEAEQDASKVPPSPLPCAGECGHLTHKARGQVAAAPCPPPPGRRRIALEEAPVARAALRAAYDRHARMQGPTRAQKRRDKAAAQQREREQRIADEAAAAGESDKAAEQRQLEALLAPLGLCIREIAVCPPSCPCLCPNWQQEEHVCLHGQDGCACMRSHSESCLHLNHLLSTAVQVKAGAG